MTAREPDLPADHGEGGRARAVVVALIGVSVALAVVGNALTPLLLRVAPVGLLALQASYPQMALTSGRIDPVVFVLVAGVRRWAGEVVAFLGARVLGPAVMARLGGRRAAGMRIPTAVRLGGPTGQALLALAVPHPFASVALGLTSMPVARFLVLKLIGSLASVVVIRWLAVAASSPLDALADAVGGNALPLTLVTATLVLGSLLWRRRASSDAAPDAEDPRDDAER